MNAQVTKRLIVSTLLLFHAAAVVATEPSKPVATPDKTNQLPSKVTNNSSQAIQGLLTELGRLKSASQKGLRHTDHQRFTADMPHRMNDSNEKVANASRRIQQFFNQPLPDGSFPKHRRLLVQPSSRQTQLNEWLTRIQQPRSYPSSRVSNDLLQQQSLTNFKRGDFEAAAADAFDALKVADAWNWPTLLANFSDRDEYVRHYRGLQQQAAKTPTANALFLLAYHERMLGHAEELAEALGRSTALMEAPLPTDVVTRLTIKNGPPPARAKK